MANMLPDLLDRLSMRKNHLLSQRREIEEELSHLNALIMRYESGSPKQPRVRGVLAAARKAVQQLQDPFDKNQLIEKLKEIDGGFATREISGSNIRNALRLLTEDGVIRKEREATSTSCAKYVKAA